MSFDPACFIGWECRVVQFDEYVFVFRAGVMCLTCGVVLYLIHILLLYYILYIIILLSSSFPVSSPSPPLPPPYFPPQYSFYTCRYLPVLIYVLFLFPLLLFPHPFPSIFCSFPSLPLPLIQSIRVGTSLGLFIFPPHRQSDPACFIGVDG